MIKRANTALWVGSLVLALSCASTFDVKLAKTKLRELTDQCLGQIRNGQLLIFGAGNSASRQSADVVAGLELGKYSQLGNKVLGWNSDGVFSSDANGRIALDHIHLDAPILDLSRDGSLVVLVGTDRRTGKSGTLIVDSNGVVVQHLALQAQGIAISPDGRSLAYERDKAVKIFGTMASLERQLPPTAVMPSWSSSGDELSFVSQNAFHIITSAGDAVRTIPVRGTPLSALHWSGNERAMMYVARTAGDYWSSPSCTERFHLVIVDSKTGEDFEYHIGCSSYPERTQWLGSEVCPRPEP